MRKNAIEAGWLHYESGTKSVAGKYWVRLPDGYEITAEFQGQIGTECNSPGNNSERNKELASSESERQRGAMRNGKGAPFIPNPVPKPKRVSTKFDPFKIELPKGLRTPEFETAWRDWIQHRIEIKKPLTEKSVDRQLKRFVKLGAAKAVAAIDYTIENGWIGIREPETNGKPVESDTARRVV